MSEHGVPVPTEMQRSSRDPAVLQDQLETWLVGRLPSDACPAITAIAATSATGLSSDTILMTAEWNEGSDRTARELVARIAPDAADVPVFPSYDLERQFRVIGDVGRLSAVPVPDLYWSENDTAACGRALLRDGASGRTGPARPDALHVRRQLAVRRLAGGSSAASVDVGHGAHRSARHRAGGGAVRLPRFRRRGGLRRFAATSPTRALGTTGWRRNRDTRR